MLGLCCVAWGSFVAVCRLSLDAESVATLAELGIWSITAPAVAAHWLYLEHGLSSCGLVTLWHVGS